MVPAFPGLYRLQRERTLGSLYFRLPFFTVLPALGGEAAGTRFAAISTIPPIPQALLPSLEQRN